MTTETITLASVETDGGGVRWTVALDLSRDSLERLFALSLLDGERFDSMHDAAQALAHAIALDRKHAPVLH